MLQEDSRNREEGGRGGGGTSAGEATSQAQPAGRHHSGTKDGPTPPRVYPSNINPRPLSGAIKRGPRAFGTWGDINKGEGMKKKTKHPFALLY